MADNVMSYKELEDKLKMKSEVIDMQVEVLDEYRKEIFNLQKKMEKKEKVICNLQKIIRESFHAKPGSTV